MLFRSKYRYNKKYNIYIGNQLITQNWINILINMIYMNMELDEFININKFINPTSEKKRSPTNGQNYKYIEFNHLMLPDIKSNDTK